MKKINAGSFFRDDIFQLSVIISFLAQLSAWGILYWRVRPTDDPVALQYNIYFGISLIGAWYEVFLLPVTGLLIFLINLSLAFGLSSQERLAARLLMVFAAAAQLITLFSAHLITTFI